MEPHQRATDDTPLVASQAAQNVSLFLDEFKLGTKSKEQTLQLIIGTIKAFYHPTKDEVRRKQLVENVLQGEQHPEERETRCLNEEVIVSLDEKKQVAPFLSGFGIPMYPKILSVILWEITKV